MSRNPENPRGRTGQLVEAVESLGDALALARRAVVAYGAYGVLTPEVCLSMLKVLDGLDAAYGPVPGLTVVVYDLVAQARALLEAGSVSSWVGRRAREAAADEQRLERDGLVPALSAD